MSGDLLANHEIASAAVQSRGFNLGWLRDPARDVVLVAVNDEGCALSYVNEQLQGDREIVLAAVKSDGFALQFASEALRADREVVLAAVTRGIVYDFHEYRQHDIDFYFEEGYEDEEQLTAPLSFAAAHLLGDRDCVMAAVSSDPGTFKLVSAELQRDREVILAALKMEPEILCTNHLSYLTSNREFALEAIAQNADVVEYFHETIRDDREVILKAVARNALVIAHASDALRADKNIALTILREENAMRNLRSVHFHVCKAFKTFSSALRADKEVVVEALKACHGHFIDPKTHVLDCVSREFKSDRDVVLAALMYCKIPYADGVLMWVSDVLLSDLEIITAAVKLHPSTLRHAAASLRGDRRFILDVIAQNRSSHCASVLEHCSVSLRDDREVVHACIKQYSPAMQFASERLRADKDTVLLAATGPQGGSALQFASKELRADKDIILQVVARDGTALGHASKALRGDKDVVTTAVCGDADIVYHHLGPLKHACNSLQEDPAFLKTLCGKLNMKCVASKYEKKQAESREQSYHAERLAHSTTKDCVADLWKGREEGTAVNIEFVTSDGVRLPAHQEILMLRSPVFRAMFTSGFQEAMQEQDGCRVVSIDDFDSEVLTELLRFLYTGCVAPEMVTGRAQTLFEVANKYQIPGLQTLMQQSLRTSLNVHNAIKLLVLADRHSVDDFKTDVVEFVCENWRGVMDTEVS